MTYSTLLVAMDSDGFNKAPMDPGGSNTAAMDPGRSNEAATDPGGSNKAVLRVAAGLVERLGCSVIGIAACQPMQIIYTDSYVMGDLIEQDRAHKTASIAKAEAQFRAALGPSVQDLHWRSSIGYAPLATTLAENARAADLLLISPAARDSFLDLGSRLDLGALVIQLGRPALIVPRGTEALALQHVMIGWKDTRETRRAIMDAVPLLRLADRVTLVQVAAQEYLTDARAGLLDVAQWLGRHGITAHTEAIRSTGDDASGLNDFARAGGVTCLVAGAYGHNRLREWALGGVTRDLLTQPERCTLLSH